MKSYKCGTRNKICFLIYFKIKSCPFLNLDSFYETYSFNDVFLLGHLFAGQSKSVNESCTMRDLKTIPNLRVLENQTELEVCIFLTTKIQTDSKECMGDKTNKIHLYFFHQSHCGLCKQYKKNFFPKLAEKVNCEKYIFHSLNQHCNVTFALVNADNPLVYGYCEQINERDHVGMPFWGFYDSQKDKFLQAGACKLSYGRK